jgi:ABC-type nickel/cobalt efflux system permease component RcnA
MEATAPLRVGAAQYEDPNFESRPGWKEIVLASADPASITSSTASIRDRSRELTSYPSEFNDAPQQTTASFEWAGYASTSSPLPSAHQKSGISVASTTLGRSAEGLGRGDFLSQMLSQRSLGWDWVVLGFAAAFGLGAMHALSPGHGKTIVAAYLVGSRGDARHAFFLGALVTLTHTVSVFALGLAVLFFERFVQPEKIIPVLGALSGVSIVFVGGRLLSQRFRALAVDGFGSHGHHHHHGHPRSHGHNHGSAHSHSHGGSQHTHVMPDGEVSLAGLIVLGISGGLVPCPSALILMLGAIGIGRTALGIGLLVAFSAGLALVLTAIGMAVLFAKVRLPQSSAIQNTLAWRLVPVLSAFAVMVLGGLMTLSSIGWVKPFAFVS